MTTTIHAVPVPLVADDAGVLRVEGTRVPLDNLLHEYLRGSGAEEIAGAYPTVGLDRVYTLIGYYLRHRAELDEYLRRNEAAESAVLEGGRAKQAGLRERLLARTTRTEAGGVALPGG
jgi:uncharacterized protein (DUF433 family)